MKRKTLFFLLGLLFLVPLSLRAYDFKSGDLYYNITSNTEPYTVEVTYETNYTGNYTFLTTAVIPETVTRANGKTYAVTSIGWSAFSGCSGLTSITIPNSVTSIRESAFSGCSGLTSVIWNAKNAYLWQYSVSPFYDSRSKITSFTFGNEVEHIPAHLCKGMSKLTSVTIPESVTSIGYDAFAGTAWYNNKPDGVVYINKMLYLYKGEMPANTSIVVKDGTTIINQYAFRSCSRLISVTIPESVTSIGEYAFRSCSGLTSITIPESVTSIGESAFSDCSGLTSVIWNAKNCADFSRYDGSPFYHIYDYDSRFKITSFTFGNEVEHIPAYLCDGMSALTSVTIPESVTSIGESAFSNSGITDIRFPENVTSIGSFVLAGCPVNCIIASMKTPVSLSNNMIGSSRSPQNVSLIVPQSSAYSYISAAYWKDFAIKTQAFSSRSVTTQTTVRMEATCLGADSVSHDRLGYVFAGDTIWNDNVQSDSVTFLIEGLAPSTDYEFYLVADSVLVIDKKIEVMVDTCDGTQWREWSTQNGYWTSGSSYYYLYGRDGRYDNLSRIVTLDSGVVYTFSIDAWSDSHSGSSLTMYVNCEGQSSQTLIDISSLNSTQTTYSAAFTPDKTGEYTIRLRGYAVRYSSVYVDNISVAHTLWKTDVYSQRASFQTQAVQFNVSTNTTQTTARVSLGIDCGDVPVIDRCGFTYYQLGQSDVVDTVFFATTEPVAALDTLITNLTPNKEYYIMPFVDINGIRYFKDNPNYVNTQAVQFNVSASTTQTTARVSLRLDCGDVPVIDKCGFTYYQLGQSDVVDTVFFASTEPIATLDTLITNLTPNKEYYIMPFVDINGTRYFKKYSTYVSTKDISVFLTCGTPTETTIPITFRYDFGDAESNTGINGIEYCLGNQFTEDSDIQTIRINSMDSALSLDTIVRGLRPNTQYAFRPYVEIESIGRKYGAVKTARTESISLNVSRTNKTQTTLSLQFTYNFGDADALNTGANGIEYCSGSQFTDDSDIQTIPINSTDSALSLDTIVRGLIPNTQYTFRPYVEIESIGRKYGTVKTAWTESISLNGSRTDRTQTTLSLQFTYNFGDADIDYIDGNLGDVKSFRFYPASSTGTIDTTFTHLRPGTEYTLSASAILTSGVSCGSTSGTYTTLPVSLGTPNVSEYGQTYAVINSTYDYGDATVLRNILEFKRSQSSSAAIDTTINIIGAQTKITNLLPNTTYYYRHLLETSEGGTQTTDWQEFTTKPITLTTQEADGISNTSALLHGTVDCDQESYTEIGFEWKRSDAPATVKPQRLLVTDRVDENLLFRLEGLSGDRYYDFRTFCSYQGETYYGEWVGFLTSDKEVLVAPTVQTVGATANEQGAEMEGFIVTGTEPILQKGFEVWIKGGTDVKTTVAEGRIIRALIPEPWSYTTYQYKAYAKTASGTTYGETMEVTTGYIPRDVQDIAVTPSSNSAEVTWTEIEVADYYILTLFADEAMTDTLAVYQVGTDGSISRLRMPSAVKALVTCSIEDLTPATDYYFAVVAYNSADQKVAEESGTFATEPDPTGIRQTMDEPSPAVRKILYRGQVFILRNGKTYTLTGQEIR